MSDHNLVLESQAGRSVGYRQALEYLNDVWGFPRQEGGKGYLLQVLSMKKHMCIASYSFSVTALLLQIPRENLHKSFLEFLATYQAKTRQGKAALLQAHCKHLAK